MAKRLSGYKRKDLAAEADVVAEAHAEEGENLITPARFKEQDKDSGGQLAKDEMPERLRDRFDTFVGDGTCRVI